MSIFRILDLLSEMTTISQAGVQIGDLRFFKKSGHIKASELI